MKRSPTRLAHRLEGEGDVRQLRRRLERFPHNGAIARARTDLADKYGDYVATVSTPGMAASLETMSVLLATCRALGFQSVIDLGSGFSSYVARVYSLESAAQVVSVDDSVEWLDRTREFLGRHHLASIGKMRAWDEFTRTPTEADLVFHDLAGGRVREAAMPVAARMAREMVIFDDAHHRGHRRQMRRTSRDLELTLYSIRPLTLDRLGRWSMLALR